MVPWSLQSDMIVLPCLGMSRPTVTFREVVHADSVVFRRVEFDLVLRLERHVCGLIFVQILDKR